MHRVKGARASSKYDFENNKQEAAEIKKRKHAKNIVSRGKLTGLAYC